MKLEYSQTLDDYKAALALHNRQSLINRSQFLFFFRVMPAFAAFGLLFQIYLVFTEKEYFAKNPPVTLFPLFVFLSLPLLRAYNIRRQFNLLFPSSRINNYVSLDIDNERIISVIPGLNEGKFSWNAIIKFAQDKRITLLYVAKNRFLFIPTTTFSSIQRSELDNLVISHGLKGKSC
jgi:hypothetical protein